MPQIRLPEPGSIAAGGTTRALVRREGMYSGGRAERPAPYRLPAPVHPLVIREQFNVVVTGETNLRELEIESPMAADSQAYFWTTAWQRGERDAEADIRAGRVFRFDDVREALAWLKRP